MRACVRVCVSAAIAKSGGRVGQALLLPRLSGEEAGAEWQSPRPHAPLSRGAPRMACAFPESFSLASAFVVPPLEETAAADTAGSALCVAEESAERGLPLKSGMLLSPQPLSELSASSPGLPAEESRASPSTLCPGPSSLRGPAILNAAAPGGVGVPAVAGVLTAETAAASHFRAAPLVSAATGFAAPPPQQPPHLFGGPLSAPELTAAATGMPALSAPPGLFAPQVQLAHPSSVMLQPPMLVTPSGAAALAPPPQQLYIQHPHPPHFLAPPAAVPVLPWRRGRGAGGGGRHFNAGSRI